MSEPSAPTAEEAKRIAAALTTGNAIVCYTKCWPCMADSHFDPPEPHTWGDLDDFEHAKATGQPEPGNCGCWCAKDGQEPTVSTPDPKTVRDVTRTAAYLIRNAAARAHIVDDAMRVHDVDGDPDGDSFQNVRASVTSKIEAALAPLMPPFDVPDPVSEQQQDGAAGRLRAAHALRAEHGTRDFDYDDDDVAAALDERKQLAKLLGIGIDREQWDAIAETEGRRYESEQTDDTLVGYLAYQRESSRVLSRHLQREVKELEAERDALAARIAELEQALADVDMTFKLGHGGAWCVSCHGAMREGTTVVKTLGVVCQPCASDLAATAGRLDPSRLAARNERDGEPRG